MTSAAYQRGGPCLAQAVAAEAGAILMGYDEDVADVAGQVQAIGQQGVQQADARHIPRQRFRRAVQYKHRRPPAGE